MPLHLHARRRRRTRRAPRSSGHPTCSTPRQQKAYAPAGSEYLDGPDVLVAPVTTADDDSAATTSVWFPPGSPWTDYFTGRTYQGGTTQTSPPA